MNLIIKTHARIYGTHSAWSLSPAEGSSDGGVECEVTLEIQGDGKSGFHLVESPDGFFAADGWFQTLLEAKQTALERWDIAINAWPN